jgi:hypothetical protein
VRIGAERRVLKPREKFFSVILNAVKNLLFRYAAKQIPRVNLLGMTGQKIKSSIGKGFKAKMLRNARRY